MSDVNIPLLRNAVEWAEAEHAKGVELSEWEQAEFVIEPTDRARHVENLSNPDLDFDRDLQKRMAAKAPECGTCYCIAGYIASNALRAGEEIVDGDAIYGPAGAFDWIADRAMRELGIDYQDATSLFAGNNTIEDVRRIAEDIAGERL